MSAQQNKALVERLMDEVWNKGNLSIIDELVAENVVPHSPEFGGPGRENFRNFVAGTRAAFPDGRATFDDLLAEGDRVVLRWTYSGTHRGEMMGIPPTGRSVTMSGITIFRIAGGQVVERWDIVDNLGMLQQLGVIPAQ